MKIIEVIDQNTNYSFSFYDNYDGVILREFEGFEYSPVRSSIEPVAGPQSGIYVTSKFGPRIMSWVGDLVGESIFTNRRLLLQAMRQEGRIKLIKFTTYDDLELQCEAEITKIVFPYTHQIHTFLVEATAPDWRFYSQSQTDVSSANSTQNVTNNGNEKTDPVIRIHGPFTSVTVTNLSTSQTFTITLDEYTEIAESEYIEINVKERTVKNDSGESLFAYFSGDFMDLQPGVNTIQFSPVGGDEYGNTSLEFIYRDAYNGI